MGRDKPQEAPQCAVPGCDSLSEFMSPGYWCSKHWHMWWEWPEQEPPPEWMASEPLADE